MSQVLRTPAPMASDQAVSEFLELVTYAENEPGIAVAFEKFLKLGLSAVICDIDRDATERAGHLIAHYHLNERLSELLLAARAGKFKDCERQRIGG